ncbi:MAG TPA: ferritin family protein [Candidatus Krumholzibacteria bacterium]|nr:ferritin family protein [Candidatus Krumholzibacteria bacterium]HPD72428.1 ferritin family protein [Candidatus Krumholzibacteria bacterium]HRY40640.1 ferritin family protein [Candidatus Krumholzibacteria bacterium]
MNDDVRECLDILARAVSFEETGMAFFLDRAANAPGELERNLFRSLAEDEKGHKAYLLKLRSQLLANHDPNDMQPEGDADHRSARQIFESALEHASDPYAAEPAELEILKGAMEVERKGYAMYTRAVASVRSARAKEIFQELAREEQNHYTLLKNTYDYMADPEGWHGFDESPMLDGG